MKLEEFRENSIGHVALTIKKRDSELSKYIKLNFEPLAVNAFYNSAAQVEKLELSRGQIDQGNSAQVVIGSWFLLMESFINNVLKTLSILADVPEEFEQAKKKELSARIAVVFELSGADRVNFYKEIYPKVNEFQCFRNELFHDRTYIELQEYKHTVFTSVPLTANQVDIMQAASITINVMNALRYLVPKVDLMPNVLVQLTDNFFYKKLDELYVEILEPLFWFSLEKHGLKSDVVTNVFTTKLEQTKFALDEFEISGIIQAKQSEKFDFLPSDQVTCKGRELYQNVQKSVHFSEPGLFKVQDYQRKF